MPTTIKSPKKLIEVALPLDAINTASAKEKTIRHGHPSNLHRWWARRPFVSARAVVFAQMVNDPSWKWEMENPGLVPPNNIKASWAASRKRIFSIIEDMVKWENTNNEEVLGRARAEIRKSWRETCELNKDHPSADEIFNPDILPAFHDPFCGGGALPVEAQRLGLETFATDLNPVAVLINKAMIEIPPMFDGFDPVNPGALVRRDLISRGWEGAQGLADDVRYYGSWMRSEAIKRVGDLYPPIFITSQLAEGREDLAPIVGSEFPVIAWVWARTVKSPNPAFKHIDVPLVSSFLLSSKAGKETYVNPVIEDGNYRFNVIVGPPTPEAKAGTKLSRANFKCIMSDSPISGDYIKQEGKAGRIGSRLMAVVAEGRRGRIYLPPTPDHELVAQKAKPVWKPEVTISGSTQYLGVKPYGMDRFDQLFTDRQLLTLVTMSDLVSEARIRVKEDAIAAGMKDDSVPLNSGGIEATGYSEAISVYLGIILSKTLDSNNALCPWEPVAQCTRQLFGRQAISMIWDYGEANPLHDSSGGLVTNINGNTKAFDNFPKNAPRGHSRQADAATQEISLGKVISTDPPYYDNVPYADLSDFFYVWLRRSLRDIYPDIFSTLSVPKIEELVAFAYRHENKKKAEAFFLNGMTHAMHRLAEHAHRAFPVTIYYAFKQAETDEGGGTSSTGWETFLNAVIDAGFAISGTWPIRTEMVAAMKTHKNNLASSIVLVCRPREEDAASISRRAFLRELNQVLPEALDEMTKGAGAEHAAVAPVDLSQAIIGPGMAVFSKYASVIEADGAPMTVRTALQLINRFLAEDDFDADTQFCLHWFEEHGWTEGLFGEADQLARSKGTAVNGVQQAGVISASAGKVRLLRPSDYPDNWSLVDDDRLPVWELLHQIIRLFRAGGYDATGAIILAAAAKADAARQLAYRLYTLCERQGWIDDARAYNEIITSWTAIEDAASRAPKARQANLFDA